MVIVEQTEPLSAVENPSMDDLRKLMANPDAEMTQPETEAEATPKQPEGTGDVLEPTKEPVVEAEAELPKGVQKRIEKEAERQAEFQRIIDEARSKTKALEAEAAKLAGTGAEPDKTPKTDENARPQKPNFATFEGTGDEFAAALEEYDANLEKWLEDRTSKTVESKFQERQAREAAQQRWDSAVKEHGDKWESSVKTVSEVAPEPMQIAISALDNWSKVAVHLAANPAALTALADQFKAHPPGSPGFFKAVAQLGRLEADITAVAEKTPVAAPKPKVERLPPPLSAVEAPAEEGTGGFDYASASPAQRRAYLLKGGLLD